MTVTLFIVAYASIGLLTALGFMIYEHRTSVVRDDDGLMMFSFGVGVVWPLFVVSILPFLVIRKLFKEMNHFARRCAQKSR